MDIQILSYILKVAIALAVFCVLFCLFFKDENFHKFNRIALLFTSIVSFILPMLTMRLYVTVPLEGNFLLRMFGKDFSSDFYFFHSERFETEWGIVGKNAFLCYVFGAVLCFITCSISVVSVIVKFKRNKPVEILKVKGKTIKIYTVSDGMSFSWMNNVAIDRSDYLAGGRKLKYIMSHEVGHVLGCHSYDILVMNFLLALQWFNPFMYLMRNFLTDIHEYQADGNVLKDAGDEFSDFASEENTVSNGLQSYSKEYKYLLLSKAVASNPYLTIGGLSSGSVSDRIEMMNKYKSPNIRKLRILYVPLVIFLVLIFFGAVYVTFKMI